MFTPALPDLGEAKPRRRPSSSTTEMSISPATTTNVRPNASETDEDVRRHEVEQVRRAGGRSSRASSSRPRPRGSGRRAAPPSARHARLRDSCAPRSRHRRLRRASAGNSGPAAPAQVSWSRFVTSASIVTATTIAVPSKKIFQNSEILQQCEAVVDRRDEQRAEDAPSTVPEPPKTFTPPITTAVTTSSSKPLPATASTLAKRAANMKPPSPPARR